MASHSTLTVVIPTKNSEALLPACLESVAFADEIIVVDMNSTDRTAEICATMAHCRLHLREDYIFGNVNFGFARATGAWTLRLDSDERITEPLQREIKHVLARGAPDDVVGYELREELRIMGRPLRHGRGRARFRKMLFRTGQARYLLEHEHEDLVSEGRWIRLVHPYVHLNYASVSEFLTKMDYYTARDVERVQLEGPPPSLARGAIEVARALWRTLGRERAYRDGYVGVLDAGMSAVYQFVYWAKVREAYVQRELRSGSVEADPAGRCGARE